MKTWAIQVKSFGIKFQLFCNELMLYRCDAITSIHTKIPVNNFLLIGNNSGRVNIDTSSIPQEYAAIELKLIIKENEEVAEIPLLNITNDDLVKLKETQQGLNTLPFPFAFEEKEISFKLAIWDLQDLSQVSSAILLKEAISFYKNVQKLIDNGNVAELMTLQNIKFTDFTTASDTKKEEYFVLSRQSMEQIASEQKEYYEFDYLSARLSISLNKRVVSLYDSDGFSPIRYKSLDDLSEVEFPIHMGMKQGSQRLEWVR